MLTSAAATDLRYARRRVILADPHPLVVEGLARVLDDAGDVRVVHRSHSGADLLAALVNRSQDLLILDPAISAPSGLAVLERAREQGIETPTILFTALPSDKEVLDAIRLGIRGLVRKDAPVQAVVGCVRTVIQGGSCLDQALVCRAMAAMLTREAALRQLARQLTVRQLEVVQLVVSALPNREIAGRLFVSEGTLKVHLHHIFERLNVSSRKELIALAHATGFSPER